MASFVLKPSPSQNLQFGVLPLRAFDLSQGGGQLLLREVLALQKARQIRRAYDQPAIKKLHLAPTTPMVTLRLVCDSCLSQGVH